MVITRYLYKPTAARRADPFQRQPAPAHLRRRHRLAARQAADRGQVLRALASTGRRTATRFSFISNREPEPDRVFNYDIFAVERRGRAPSAGSPPRKSAEYRPVWSPDGSTIAYRGTTRELTSSETTMEDTHVWVMSADGTDAGEMRQVAIDNRQGPPRWSPRRAGGSTSPCRSAATVRICSGFRSRAANAATVVADRQRLGRVVVARAGNGGATIAYASPRRPIELAELYVERRAGAPTRADRRSTGARSRARSIAPVEAFTSRQRRDAGRSVPDQAGSVADRKPGKHPLIVMIHGGPHGQQGPAFNAKAQVYAARGWAR